MSGDIVSPHDRAIKISLRICYAIVRYILVMFILRSDRRVAPCNTAVLPFFAAPQSQVLVVLPLLIWQLVDHKASRHIIAWFVGGLFMIMAVVVSLHDGTKCPFPCGIPVYRACDSVSDAVAAHLLHYTRPFLQRHVIRIMLMVRVVLLRRLLSGKFASWGTDPARPRFGRFPSTPSNPGWRFGSKVKPFTWKLPASGALSHHVTLKALIVTCCCCCRVFAQLRRCGAHWRRCVSCMISCSLPQLTRSTISTSCWRSI